MENLQVLSVISCEHNISMSVGNRTELLKP